MPALGHLRLDPYGLLVAAGLLGALSLGRRTARLAGIDPDAVWNVGLFGLGAAFVFSRLLLAAVSPAALLHYPLLLLTLPSLTWTGIALTLFAVLAYTRVQKLPVLRLLDAFAPPSMLFAAALAFAHRLEGSSPGMPIHGLTGPTHPVQLYAAVVALVLFCVAMRALRRSSTPDHTADHPSGHTAGHTAALTLSLAGLAAFLLDMLAQPFDVLGTSWLDPGQFVALACLLAGTVLYLQAHPSPPRT